MTQKTNENIDKLMYEKCVENIDFIDVLPSVIQKINELKA